MSYEWGGPKNLDYLKTQAYIGKHLKSAFFKQFKVVGMQGKLCNTFCGC